MSPVVVKLGGSLLGSPELAPWLRAIAEHGRGRAVIVPGGGHHADAVRRAQAEQGFDDAAAHRRAMEAMRMTARDFLAIESSLRPAASLADISSVLAANGVPVAVPIEEWSRADDIVPSWDWTSDSLALWLAQAIDASRILLVKSVTPEMPSERVGCVAERGVVDGIFPLLLKNGSPPAWWAGANQCEGFARWLENTAGYCRLTGNQP